MAAIGSLVFCTDCGNLLDANTGRKAYIQCDVCGTQNKDTSSKVVVTTSKPSAFPSTLRTKLRSDVQEVSEADMQTDATIKQTCEKCGCEEVRYYTQQLRSADEGSTVFYTCPQCGHKWNTNN
ncbi:DNA-directed RNA polymerase I core subunit rpa12 [Vermiconidia calcicola]|uniref:DNA-directed RNA polymerase I core subunit rpa12 n=2 Tax=Vermiconidia calcicola TaxID=1690605 RepID=A0ACC3MK52_9PEZI|nr:DNA-directed RNA polymerase I core subunit rpa12 [Vermiconidia calcicola]KAK3697556.1 DNA-directed RNA polymerase I core subunit rpa12 [Vermiconidia calcicola]